MKNKLALVLISAFGMICADNPAVSAARTVTPAPVALAVDSAADKFVKCLNYLLWVDDLEKENLPNGIKAEHKELAYHLAKARLVRLDCLNDIKNLVQDTLKNDVASRNVSSEEKEIVHQQGEALNKRFEGFAAMVGLSRNEVLELLSTYADDFRKEVEAISKA